MEKVMSKIKQKNIINYDSKSDVFYVGIKNGEEQECVEVAPGINVELDQSNQVIGIEILHASKIFKPVYKKFECEKSLQHVYAVPDSQSKVLANR